MKRILRAAVGTLFFVSFMSFLFVTAVKFRVLSADFWITALNKSQAYQQLSNEIVKLSTKMEEDVVKAGRQGKAVPKEVRELLAIDEKLPESRLRELGETNVKRLFGFVNKETEDLFLFLPVREWGLPVSLLGKTPATNWTAQTPLESVTALFSKTPEQTKKSVDQIKQLRNDLTQINLVWLGLLVLSLVLLAGHYFLGEGMVDRISGTAWTVMLSGFLAKFTGFGVVALVGIVLTQSKDINPAIVLAVKSLAGQFFALGEWIGFLLGIVGLGVVIAVPIMVKQNKLKAEEKKIGFIKRWILFVLGVILGFVILLLTVILGVTALGGKAGIKFTTTGEKGVAGAYVSKNGWSMKAPPGWEVMVDKESEGFLKKPSGSATNWGAIEVKPLERIAEIDAGGHLNTIRKGVPSEFKNSEFVEEAKEEMVSGMKVFSVTFDYDAVISNSQMRLRAWALEFFPAKTGGGFLVISRAPVDSWDKYEKVIKESVATFTLPK